MKHGYLIGVFAQDKNGKVVNCESVECCEAAFRNVFYGISHSRLATIRKEVNQVIYCYDLFLMFLILLAIEWKVCS
jgi:hypothetical protein